MLSPIWLICGLIGAFAVRRMRRRNDAARFHASLLFLPLFAGSIESQIPVPHETVTLTRSVIVHASPSEIWPYAVSNAHIGNGEGRWTFSQSVLGLPVPAPRCSIAPAWAASAPPIGAKASISRNG
jgi:hypothetical protein